MSITIKKRKQVSSENTMKNPEMTHEKPKNLETNQKKPRNVSIHANQFNFINSRFTVALQTNSHMLLGINLIGHFSS